LVLSSRWRAVFWPDAGERRGGELDFSMGVKWKKASAGQLAPSSHYIS